MRTFLLLFLVSLFGTYTYLAGGFSDLLAAATVYTSQPATIIESAPTSETVEHAATTTINDTIAAMTTDEKIGQLFIVGHWREDNYYHMSNLIRAHHLGGVILMGMDSSFIPEVPDWVATWQAESKIPLLISTDQEGGVVSRFRTEEFELTPQPDIENATDALLIARQRAAELSALGVNTNLAPVLERSIDPFAFLYDRTFRDPDKITTLGTAMIVGYREAGVVAVPKHFPGHEDTPTDSHVELPILTVSAEDFVGHIKDFSNVLQVTEPEALMTAHVLIPALDPDYPATLSKTILTDTLRNQISFDGVIMTDDMAMGAITNDYDSAEAALMAFQAGADMILMAARPNDTIPAIERFKTALQNGEITEQQLDESLERILRMKQIYAD